MAETELARLLTSKGLPSTRRCSGRGRGGDLLFLAEREYAPPCPVRKQGGGRAIVALNAYTCAAFVAGARQAPVGRTALDEWVSPTKATRTRG